MKKISGILAVLFLLSLNAIAQTSGSSEGLNRFLSQNLKYPTELRQSDTEGEVVISIEIDPKGYMTGEYQFLSGDTGFKGEIDRTLGLLKEKWDPSFLAGKSFNQEYLMSFDFQLSKGKQFPPNPFIAVSKEVKTLSPLETVNHSLELNPFSPELYNYRAEIMESNGKKLQAEMDLNQANFLKNKTLTKIVIVGYQSSGPKSL